MRTNMKSAEKKVFNICIKLIHEVEAITQLIKIHKEFEADSAVDHAHVEPRTQEINNHKQTTIHKSNATSTAEHSCPAINKICSKCAEPEVCRSTNVKYLVDRNEERQEEIETENETTDNDPVAYAELKPKEVGKKFKRSNFQSGHFSSIQCKKNQSAGRKSILTDIS